MNIKNANILIVDDESDIRMLIQEALQVFELPIYCAKDGKEAVTILGQKEIAVALIDYKMPNINGIELIEYIYDCCKFVVPLFLTGFADLQELTEIISLNVFDYIEKPFSVQMLQQRVSKALQKHSKDKLAYLGIIEFVKEKCNIINESEIKMNDDVLYANLKEALIKMGHVL